MENLMMLFSGFGVVFTLENLGVCLLGAILGLVVGAMPGIGSLAGCALLLPLTYKFEPTAAIIMLGALYYSNMYGGAFSAILLNIPGDSPAVMTARDGYPMAQKGQPGQALFAANVSSCIGGIIGMLILTFLGPALAHLGLQFGPAQMAALMIMALTSIGWLLGEDDPVKGTIATLLGFVVASIGMDTLTGAPRFNFGNMYLMGGIPFISFVIGAVGFSQVIDLMIKRHDEIPMPKDKLTLRGSLLNRKQVKRIVPVAIRSGFLGTLIGVLPGSGATTAAVLSYSIQTGFQKKNPEAEKMGEGAIEGIAASESANNSAAAGAFAPLLALGIPGSGTGAVLLGGLMMWGLEPGPLLFTNEPEFAWGLIASLFVANIFALLIAMGIIPYLIKILAVPVKYMIPIVTCICFVGAYATSNSMYGVIIMVVSGIIGYFFKKAGIPVTSMLLSYVLSPIFEGNMRKAFIISGGNPMIFFSEPVACAFMVITILLVCSPMFKKIYRKAKANKTAA